MSRVNIDCTDNRPLGWRYFTMLQEGSIEQRIDMRSDPYPTYGECVRAARAAGHEVNNAGWLHRMHSWQFDCHAIQGYPEWELVGPTKFGVRAPAFVKLTHVRKQGVESDVLCREWDDLAREDFYQRDWTSDGIPFVREGETYWSGWWFQSSLERDRFLELCSAKGLSQAPQDSDARKD